MKTHERSRFPLFQSHIDHAHSYWQESIVPGSIVIDATCGNGHDTLFLAQFSLDEERNGLLIGLDKQPEAIKNTQKLITEHLPSFLFSKIQLHHQCHSQFPEFIAPGSVSLIVYNLGYLPGGDKSITTNTLTTLESLKAAFPLICHGGAISITCYPGHEAGKEEEGAVLDFCKQLNPKEWSCCYHRWINRKEAPGLLLLQRCMI